ncbi:hypothetical protein FGE12_24305 [Aggregicoccus sp. 17bor-14]|uniref:hypothetical protein n=1 Tax=Myxococcaceae TaxID=31 RepID=UPI00129CC83F|nr:MULTISPECIES: hypothetical protein [Myxococcaceae]MBF5045553.1 hypothetical protein [Simulacricoccus sp. 17bor-14]MRI91290.1 hypothetical protein [Aggregicoccus sp. 17bor-14]
MRALVLGVLLAALPARAQTPPAVRTLVEHMARGIRKTQVGDWVTYKLDGGGKRVHYWRLAAVSAEKDRLGRDALWIEVDMGTHPGMAAPLAQMKMLVAKDVGLSAQGITRLIVATGFDRPQEYSPEALAAALRKEPSTAAPAPPGPGQGPRPAIQAGREVQLMTLAGTVPAVPLEMRYRNTVVKRLWFSREIPVLQIAKIEIPGIGQAMEVRDFGVDAKPLMQIPPPDAPKVRLEYLDEAFAKLPQLPEGEGE